MKLTLPVDRPIPPAAHTIDAIRYCPHLSWTSRSHTFQMTYTALLETPGPAAIAAVITSGRRNGHLTDVVIDPAPGAQRVGSLYVCAADSSVLADYFIPSEESWQWWVTAAELRLTDIDCPTCSPDH